MRILVVVDNEDKRMYLKYMLKLRKIEVHLESAVDPALTYIHSYHDQINGIILDLGLPSRETCFFWKRILTFGGLDILREMTSMKLDIPVLIHSYDELTVNYENHLVDIHNIKGESNPLKPDYSKDIHSFISAIENGEF